MFSLLSKSYSYSLSSCPIQFYSLSQVTTERKEELKRITYDVKHCLRNCKVDTHLQLRVGKEGNTSMHLLNQIRGGGSNSLIDGLGSGACWVGACGPPTCTNLQESWSCCRRFSTSIGHSVFLAIRFYFLVGQMVKLSPPN